MEDVLKCPHGRHWAFRCGLCEENTKIREGVIDMTAVNHPSHYNPGELEAYKIIRAYNLNFSLGNVIKYVLRADNKGKREEDLQKALWYLKEELGLLDK